MKNKNKENQEKRKFKQLNNEKKSEMKVCRKENYYSKIQSAMMEVLKIKINLDRMIVKNNIFQKI